MIHVLLSLVIAQTPPCQGPSCSAPRGYRWHLDAAFEPDQAFLYRHGRQVGAYSFREAIYRPLLDAARETWGPIGPPPVTPPVAPPALGPPRLSALANQGVDLDKLASDSGGYKINGRPASRAEAVRALQKTLTDDRDRLRLLVIGAEADRRKFETAWAAHAGDLANQCHVSLLDPDHWWLHDRDTRQPLYRTGGTPTLYLQAPDGTILLHRDTCTGAGTIEELRRAARNFAEAKIRSLVPAKPLLFLAGVFVLVLLKRTPTRDVRSPEEARKR